MAKKKPRRINIRAEDPLDGRWLGAVDFPYRYGFEYYKTQRKTMIGVAYIIGGFGVRAPRIRTHLIY